MYSTLPVLYAVTACHGPTPDLWWCITGGGWGSCWFSCLSYYTNEYYGCTIQQYRTRRLDLKGYKVPWLVPWIKYILESSILCNAIYEIQRRSIWYWCSRWRPGCRTDQCSWQRWDTDSTARRSFWSLVLRRLRNNFIIIGWKQLLSIAVCCLVLLRFLWYVVLYNCRGEAGPARLYQATAWYHQPPPLPLLSGCQAVLHHQHCQLLS